MNYTYIQEEGHTTQKKKALFVLCVTLLCIGTVFFGFARTVAGAEVALDTTILTNNAQGHTGSPAAVCITDQTCFAFYVDSGGGISMASTTDGGATWQAGRNVDNSNTTDAVSVAIWWDGWTAPGTTTQYIHIATTDTGVDDIFYIRYDTVNNTFSNAATGTTQAAACTRGTNCYPTITKTSDNTLYMATSQATDRWVVRCTTTCTTSANWTEMALSSTTAFYGGLGDDIPILTPVGGTNNVMLLWWDTSLNGIYYNIYSATSSSWFYSGTASGTISTAAESNTTYEAQMIGMAFSTTTGVTALTFVDDANDYTTQDHDIDFWTYATATGWVQKTDPVTTATGGLTGAKVSYDERNDTWYVLYGRRSTIGTATTSNIYYRTSTDGGTSWSSESVSTVNDNTDDINALTTGITSFERIGAWWNYTTAPRADDEYYSTVVDIIEPVILYLSGSLYSDEGATLITTPRNLGIAIGTTTTSIHATTSLSNGTWNITVPTGYSISSSTPILVWLDGYGTTTAGAVITKSNGVSTISGLDLYQNRLIVRHEAPTTSTSTTIQDLSFYDGNNDSDIQFTATTSGSANLYVRANQKLYIWPTDTFVASGTVTVAGNASSTSQTDGSLHIASGATFKSVGTTTLAGSFTASNTASFQQATGTLLFNATTTGKLITAFGQNLGTTTFNGSGGGWTMGTTSTTSNLTITTGTLTAPSSRLTITGNYTNNGTFNHNNGTTTFFGTTAQTATGTLSGTSAFAKLEVKNTATTTFGAALTATTSFSALEQNSVLVFSAGATATLATTTITGTTGNPIKLRSTGAGTQWLLLLNGPYALSYVDVQDSNACPTTGGTDITWSNLTYSGNNSCWDSTVPTYTQPSLISATTVTSVALSSSASVSVPTSTELIVMFWTAYAGVNGNTLSTSSMSGLGFTFRENVPETGGSGNAYVLGTLVWPYGTSTVNSTFSWTMGSVPTEGAIFTLAFIKDASSTAPVTDTNGALTTVGSSTSTIDVYSPTSYHLVIGELQSYLVKGSPDGAGTDQSIIGGIDGFTYNSEVVSLLKENTTDTPTTTLTGGGDYLSLMGISIAPKVTGGSSGGGGNTLLLSGTLYVDEGITPFNIARNLGIAIGTTTTSVLATTSLASGAWNYTLSDSQYIASSTPILVWLDGYGTTTAGAVFTKAKGTSSITGLDLYQNRLIVRHEGGPGTTTRVVDMAFYDADDDSDIQYIASTSALVVKANQKLYVWPSDSLTASGTVEIRGNASSTSQTDGSFHLATSSMYYAGGQTTIGGSFTASTGAQFFHNEYNTLFNATTTGKVINAPLATLGTTTFNGSGGGWTFATTSTTSKLTITAGTVTGPTSRLVVTGNYTNSGGTFTQNNGTTTFGGLSTQSATGTLTGTSALGNTEVMVATSTWNAASAAAANSWTSVAYGNGVFVAISSDGANRVMTSTDGISWSSASAAAASTWSSVTFGNGLFVAVTSSGGASPVMTSPDGTTWTSRSVSTADGSTQWASVAYGNGLFIAVGFSPSDNETIMSSRDGINWIAGGIGSGYDLNAITYGNGRFVAVGANLVLTATQGAGFVAGTPINSNTWTSVAYGNGRFVAGSSFASNPLMTSTDGLTWSTTSVSAIGAFTGITYGDGKFVALASNMYTSSDGIQWATTSLPNTGSAVTYGNGRFVAVASSGTNRVIYGLARESSLLLGSPASTTNLVIGQNATVTAPTSTLSIAGSYNNSGIFRANGGTTTFNGTGVQTIDGTLTGTSTFNNLGFSGAGAKTFMGNASSTNFLVESSSGAVTFPSHLTVGGNFTANGTITAGSGTTTFSSSSPQRISGTLTGSSQLANVVFAGTGSKTLASNASTSNLTIESGSTLVAPTQLSISGNYFNNTGTFTHNSGTTTFNGTGVQSATGTMTGTSAFNNLRIANTSANGTTSQSVVFNAPLTTSGTFSMLASSSAAFAKNATATLQNINLQGTSGSYVWLRSTTDGVRWNLDTDGTQEAVVYVNVKDSAACGSVSAINASDGTSYDAGNNACWTFAGGGGSPSMSSAANQTFSLNGATTSISTISLTDASTPTFTSGNDIRIKIATSTVRMKWDTTDTTATFGGTASGKVSGTVSYEGGGSVLVIDVTSNFSGSDTLTISGLSFAQFTATNTAAVALAVYSGGSSDIVSDASDTRTVTITGSLTLSNHSGGQVNDSFGATNATGVTIYRFRAAPSGETFTVNSLAVNLVGISGVAEGDITNATLYRDMNSDGAYDAGDVQVGGSGAVSISGQNGTITFSTSWSGTTTQDFIVVVDLASIRAGDFMTVKLNTSGINATGVLTSGTVVVAGSVSSIQHIKGGGGSSSAHGGGGGVDGDAPPGQGVQTGGGSQGGGEIDTNTGGDTLGDIPGFSAPSANGTPRNEWTNGGNGYTSDGSYATALSAGLRQTYDNFGFSIPSNNQITGIEVKVELSGTTGAGTVDARLSWDDGGSLTSAKNSGTLTTSDTVYTFGGQGDTWGRSWTPSELQNGAFALELTGNPSSNTLRIDAIRVKVYHQSTGGGGGGGGEVWLPIPLRYAQAIQGDGKVAIPLTEFLALVKSLLYI